MPKIIEIADAMIQEIAICSAKGMSIRATARHIGITHPTLANWIKAGKTAKSGKKKDYMTHGSTAGNPLFTKLQMQLLHALRILPSRREKRRKNLTAKAMCMS